MVTARSICERMRYGANAMTALPIKQEAIEAIQRLPDLTDIEEIMYRLYVLESVRRGREDAEGGDTTPADDVVTEIQGW
jgi:hypothetical protein